MYDVNEFYGPSKKSIYDSSKFYRGLERNPFDRKPGPNLFDRNPYFDYPTNNTSNPYNQDFLNREVFAGKSCSTGNTKLFDSFLLSFIYGKEFSSDLQEKNIDDDLIELQSNIADPKVKVLLPKIKISYNNK